MAGGLARYAGARQATLARNIANADTPGFRAKDHRQFTESYRAATAGAQMRATRPGHAINSDGAASRLTLGVIDRPSGSSPNGNTVSLEAELVQAVNAQRAHNRAVTIYQTAVGILRSSLRSQR